MTDFVVTFSLFVRRSIAADDGEAMAGPGRRGCGDVRRARYRHPGTARPHRPVRGNNAPTPPVLRLNREPRERKIVHTVDTASVNAILKVCELLVV